MQSDRQQHTDSASNQAAQKSNDEGSDRSGRSGALRGQPMAVQLRSLRPGRSYDEQVAAQSPDATAAAGFSGGGSPLPHLDRIQPAFGRHNVSSVQHHSGPEAQSASRSLGASAYAIGDRVGSGGGMDLHTASHEAAHVVQQRGCVQLKGGVGQSGDAYEVHADKVADAVVRGESAEGLLDASPGGGGGGPGVQLSESNDGDADGGPAEADASAKPKSGLDQAVSNMEADPRPGKCEYTSNIAAGQIFVRSGQTLRPDRLFNDGHCHLRVDGKVVDLAMAQFFRWPEGKTPPVFTAPVGGEAAALEAFARKHNLMVVDADGKPTGELKLNYDNVRNHDAKTAADLAEFMYGGARVVQHGDALKADAPKRVWDEEQQKKVRKVVSGGYDKASKKKKPVSPSTQDS